jgi:hypothetical protein
VLSLVQGKRTLFDNVVHEDATEDVVSVSKRLAEVLAEDLATGAPENAVAGNATPEPLPAPSDATEAGVAADTEPASAPPASSSAVGSDLDDAVRDCVVALQQRFGERIARVLGQHRRGEGDAGGMGGLLVVLDRIDDSDDAIARNLSDRVPVALIDRRTLDGLSRLGAASPVADAQPIFDRDQAGGAGTEPGDPPLLRKAREGLTAARLLIQQGCPGPALDLLLSALLSAAAVRAGRGEPPTPAQAGIWLYGEALPGGLLDQQDAALLMRAIALAQGADAVPEPMLTALADDAVAFIDSAGASAA